MASAAGAARRNARDYALGPQKKLRKSSSGLRFFSSSSFQPCLRSARVRRVVASYAPASARAASLRTLTRGAGRRRPTRTGRSPCPHWPRTRKTHPPALRAEQRGCDKSGQRRRRGSRRICSQLRAVRAELRVAAGQRRAALTCLFLTPLSAAAPSSAAVRKANVFVRSLIFSWLLISVVDAPSCGESALRRWAWQAHAAAQGNKWRR